MSLILSSILHRSEDLQAKLSRLLSALSDARSNRWWDSDKKEANTPPQELEEWTCSIPAAISGLDQSLAELSRQAVEKPYDQEAVRTEAILGAYSDLRKDLNRFLALAISALGSKEPKTDLADLHHSAQQLHRKTGLWIELLFNSCS